MRILGIETSCDETAAAVVEDGVEVLSSVIATSREAFEAAGGVIPEQAARMQMESILPVIEQALQKASCDAASLDAVAVTKGPGLLGSLLVGVSTARTLATVWGKPLIGVHHTLGHLSSTWLGTHGDLPDFPVLSLSASGGHTELWFRTRHTQGRLLGSTRDDAVGEAFDKGAALLGLPYPGGPAIAKAAVGGRTDAFPFPSPLRGEDTLDYSFSGLKTALRYTLRDHPALASLRSTLASAPAAVHAAQAQQTFSDLAASYEHALCLHLATRITRALERNPETAELHLVGGVSANLHLRSLLEDIATHAGVCLRFPIRFSYCTDNAAMIAAAGAFLLQERGEAAMEPFATEASLPLAAGLGHRG
jgi:N6-L-threonylcarbamoyladenine synthase